MEALAAGTGVAAEKARRLLASPECPAEFLYLREWLYQLYGRSGTVGMGEIAPISWQTIESWARVTGIQPTPDEVDALMRLDQALRTAASEAREKETPTKPTPRGKPRGR